MNRSITNQSQVCIIFSTRNENDVTIFKAFPKYLPRSRARKKTSEPSVDEHALIAKGRELKKKEEETRK